MISGTYTGTGNINSNPNFIDAANYNFHLAENSPCIDVGTNTDNPTEDFDQNPTEQDGDNDASADADMGTFEFLQEVHSFSSNALTNYQLNTFEGSPTTIASVTLAGYSSGSGDITVNCFTKSSVLNASSGSKSVKRWYRISETSTLDYSNNATLRLYYSTDEFDLSGLSSESNLTLWKYETGSWVNKGGTVSTDSNYVELTGVTQSELTGDWAYTDVSDSPLPVSLSAFTANAGDKRIFLVWETASESDNQGFVVLRSTEEQGQYQEIDSYVSNDYLKGAGNTSQATKYSFTDRFLINGETYYYKLVDVGINGRRTEHGLVVSATPHSNNMEVISNQFPNEFALHQNFPNPFNPSTKIGFAIPDLEDKILDLSIVIYDLLGRRGRNLYEGQIAPGSYEIEWNGLNEAKQPVPSGVYVYQLISGHLFNKSKKMTLLK